MALSATLVAGSLGVAVPAQAGVSQAKQGFSPQLASAQTSVRTAARADKLTLDGLAADPTATAAGHPVTFTAKASQTTGGDLADVVVVHTLSNNLEDVSVDDTTACQIAAQVVTCTYNPLQTGAGAAKTANITAKVKAGTAAGTDVLVDTITSTVGGTADAGGSAKASVQDALATPTVTTIGGKTVTGGDAGDVPSATPKIEGDGAVAGATVAVYQEKSGGQPDPAKKVCEKAGATAGAWDCTPGTALTDGTTYKVVAVQTKSGSADSAPSTPVASFKVQVPVKPAAPANLLIDGASPGAGTVAQSLKPTISGDGRVANATLAVYQANGDGTADTSKKVCDAGGTGAGNWTCAPASDLPANTAFKVVATQTAGGETSDASTPVAQFKTPVVKPAAPQIDKPAAGDTVTELKPAFEGTKGVKDAVVSVFKQAGAQPDPGDPKVCDSAKLTADGAWNCTATADQAGGGIKVYATQTADGETSAASTAVAFTITPPAANLVLSDAGANPAKQEAGQSIRMVAKLTAKADVTGDTKLVHTLSGAAIDKVEVPAGPPQEGCTAAGLVVTCTYTDLKQGDVKQPSVTVTLKGDANPGDAIKDAVTANGPGSTEATAEIPAEVTGPAQIKAQLTLPDTLAGKRKDDLPAPLTVKNTGQAGDPTITDPEVTLTLPAALSFKSDAMNKCTASAQTVTCTFTGTNLSVTNENTRSVTDQLTVTVKPDATADGEVTAKLTKPAVSPDVTAKSTFTLTRLPELALTTDPKGPDLGDIAAAQTSPVDLKVKLNNTGTAPAAKAGYNVAIVNNDGGYVVGDGGGACKKTGEGAYSCTFTDLADGASSPQLTFRTPASAAAAGKKLEFTVTPTLDDKELTDQAVKLSGTIVTAGSLTLTTDPAQLGKVVAGDPQQIKATIENTGAAEVANAGLETYFFNAAGFSVTGDNGKCTKGASSYDCAFGALAGKGKIELTFTVVPDVKQIGKRLQVNLTTKGGAGIAPTTFLRGDIISPIALDTDVEPAKAAVGETVKFMGQLTNVAASDIENVTVKHTVSDNLEITKVTAPCTQSGQTVECVLNPVKAGAKFPADDAAWIEAKVKDQATGELSDKIDAQASIPGSNNDFAEDSDTVSAEGPVPAKADLKMTATSAQKIAKPGDKITYTLQVNNLGPDTAPPSKVTFTLTGPVASVQTGGPCTAADLTISCEVPELKAGKQVWGIGVFATTKADGSGEVKGTAEVTPSKNTQDPDPANNKAEVTTDVQEAADFQLSAAGASASAVAGKDQVTYSVSPLLLGPASVAKNVKVTGTLPMPGAKVNPSGLRRVRADACTIAGTALTCELGEVKLGDATKVISVSGLVPATATGALKATFKVTSDNPSTNPAGATAEVSTPTTTSADVAVTGKVGAIRKGKTATYTFVATNNGPSSAAKVSLRHALPKYLTYKSAKGTGCKKAGNGVACTWAKLAPKQRITVTLVANVSKSGKGTATSTAVLSTGTPDPNTKNNKAVIKRGITK